MNPYRTYQKKLIKLKRGEAMHRNSVMNAGMIVIMLFVISIMLPNVSSAQFAPGLDLVDDSSGTITWGSWGMVHSAIVYDYDGINGSNHTVTITYPGGGTYTLQYYYNLDENRAYYDTYVDSGTEPLESGTYTYEVTDHLDSKIGTAEDYVEVNPINPPDRTKFTPNMGGVQSITAFFDNFKVNGELYDDFEAGFDGNKWSWWPGEASFENGEVRLERSWNPTEPGSATMQVHEDSTPSSINELSAEVRVSNFNGTRPWARIGGTFCKSADKEVIARVGIQDNQAFYAVFHDYPDGDHWISKDLVARTAMGTITPGNKYELYLKYDPSTFTLQFKVTGIEDSVFLETSYVVPAPVTPVTDRYDKFFSVTSWYYFDSTSPEISWEEVTGAATYRLRVYDMGCNRTLHNTYVAAPPAKIPPGVLKPFGVYCYRVYAIRDNQWHEWDNAAASSIGVTRFIAGPTLAKEPYISLNSCGVETWNNPPPSISPSTSFYIHVHDAQGVPENILSVKVVFPDGTTEIPLYLSEYLSSTAGVYRGSYHGTPQSGIYTFVAEDKNGHLAEIEENFTASTANIPTGMKLYNVTDPTAPVEKLPDNDIIGDTGIKFDWNDTTGAAQYELKIWDKDAKLIQYVKTTGSEFLLPSGILKDVGQYRYMLRSREQFYEDNVDSGSEMTGWGSWSANTFFTNQITGGTATPVINPNNYNLYIVNGVHPDPSNNSTIYLLSASINVSDDDGVPENIKLVEIEFPGGERYPLKFNEYSVYDSNYSFDMWFDSAADIPRGDYKFHVTDFDNNTAAVVTDTLDDVSFLDPVTNILPLDKSTIETLTPTIQWNAVAGTTYYKVRVQASWGWEALHLSPELTTTSYTIPEGILKAGGTYGFRIFAYSADPLDPNDIDTISSNAIQFSQSHHFSVSDTPTGEDITIVPMDGTTGEQTIELTFDQIDGAGTTTVVSNTEEVPPPIGFKLGDPPVQYEIESTATYSGNIEVCIDYSDVFYQEAEEDLKLFHYEGGDWVDITTSVDTVSKTICGLSSSLSPFEILQPNNVLEVQIDIKPGSSENCFNQNDKGILPVVIFGSEDFDVSSIDLGSLSLQGLEIKVTGKKGKSLAVITDSNGDGYMDLEVKMEDSDLWIETGEDFASLTGNLLDGTSIEGRDSICFVP